MSRYLLLDFMRFGNLKLQDFYDFWLHFLFFWAFFVFPERVRMQCGTLDGMFIPFVLPIYFHWLYIQQSHASTVCLVKMHWVHHIQSYEYQMTLFLTHMLLLQLIHVRLDNHSSRPCESHLQSDLSTTYFQSHWLLTLVWYFHSPYIEFHSNNFSISVNQISADFNSLP